MFDNLVERMRNDVYRTRHQSREGLWRSRGAASSAVKPPVSSERGRVAGIAVGVVVALSVTVSTPAQMAAEVRMAQHLDGLEIGAVAEATVAAQEVRATPPEVAEFQRAADELSVLLADLGSMHLEDWKIQAARDTLAKRPDLAIGDPKPRG